MPTEQEDRAAIDEINAWLTCGVNMTRVRLEGDEHDFGATVAKLAQSLGRSFPADHTARDRALNIIATAVVRLAQSEPLPIQCRCGEGFNCLHCWQEHEATARGGRAHRRVDKSDDATIPERC